MQVSYARMYARNVPSITVSYTAADESVCVLKSSFAFSFIWTVHQLLNTLHQQHNYVLFSYSSADWLLATNKR